MTTLAKKELELLMMEPHGSFEIMGVNIQFIQGQTFINALPENYWNQEIIESMKICCALSLFFPV